jgi:putative ABC transport system permease protein
MFSLRRLFRRARTEAILDKELQFHLDRQIADYIAEGMDPVEAARRARLEFGGADSVKEEIRDTRWETRIENIVRDFHYAFRTLRRDYRFAVVVILALALGIGATTAIFSVVHADLLRPLPYRDPSRLMWADEFLPSLNDSAVIDPEYVNWRNNSKTFTSMAAFDWDNPMNLSGAGAPERIEIASATANFLETLGVHPALGRAFLPEEVRPDGPNVALLTDALWKRKFSAAPNIVGKSIDLDGKAYIVVGVLPATFRFPDKGERPDALIPLGLAATPDWASRRLGMSRVVGRLAPGATPGQALADLALLAANTQSAMPPGIAQMRKNLQVHVLPLQQQIVGDVRPALLVLLCAVGLVLLIACVNVANLQMVRTAARHKELAVRAAIGASRGRLIQQFMVEGFTLAAFGGAAGLLLAFLGVRLLRVSMPATIARLGPIALDLPVLFFALAVTCLTAVVFGLAPAVGASRPDVNDSLKDGGTRTVGLYAHRALRSALVVAEFALAFLLLIGSGLLIRSFARLSSVPPGFDPANVATISTQLPSSRYSTDEQRRAYFSQILDRIKGVPGVRSAALTTRLPFTPIWGTFTFVIEGQPEPAPGTAPSALDQEISADYFQAMRIPILEGRTFNSSDLAPGAAAIVVSQSFARRFLPQGAPFSKRVRVPTQHGGHWDWANVVGVVGDVRYLGLAAEPEPQIYRPFSGGGFGSGSVVIRSDEDPRTLIPAVRAQFAELDPSQPIFDITTMQRRLDDSIASPRFNMTLLAIFASLALVLAMIGIYGVLSYFVSQRTHEIGIRVALGALPSHILRIVLDQGALMVLGGLAIGFVGSLFLTRYLATLLFGVRPIDPLTMMAVSALLVAVALAACYVPARRALRLDPLAALRHE